MESFEQKRCLDDTAWIVQSSSLLYGPLMSIWWNSSSRATGRTPNPLSYLLDGSYNKFCLIIVLCYSLLIYNGVSLKV